MHVYMNTSMCVCMCVPGVIVIFLGHGNTDKSSKPRRG